MSCTLVKAFAIGQLDVSGLIDLFYHLEQCNRCKDKVRELPEATRQELYRRARENTEIMQFDAEIIPKIIPEMPFETASKQTGGEIMQLQEIESKLRQRVEELKLEQKEIMKRLEAIGSERQAAQDDLEALQRVREIAEKYQVDPDAKPKRTVARIERKSPMSQKEAIRKVLAEESPLRAVEIAERVRALGVQMTDTSVWPALSPLRKAGIVETGQDEAGIRIFSLAQNGAAA